MSNAKPMLYRVRRHNYLEQGQSQLTPTQRRRLKHKKNHRAAVNRGRPQRRDQRTQHLNLYDLVKGLAKPRRENES
jgi:hypothetical protein